MRHIHEEMLMGYISGELSQSEIMEVELHLEMCNVCKMNYHELMLLTAEWDEPSLNPSDDFVSKIMKEVKTVHVPVVTNSQKKQLWTHYLLSAAATIILVNYGLFTEFTSVSYQFIYGIGQFSEQFEGITTTSLELLQGINFDYILQLWNKE